MRNVLHTCAQLNPQTVSASRVDVLAMLLPHFPQQLLFTRPEANDHRIPWECPPCQPRIWQVAKAKFFEQSLPTLVGIHHRRVNSQAWSFPLFKERTQPDHKLFHRVGVGTCGYKTERSPHRSEERRVGEAGR